MKENSCKCKPTYSGIGGQAVMEGIMMKNAVEYAVAVRKPNGEIEVSKGKFVSFSEKHKITGLPFIRGIFSFIDSMVLGIRTLMWSASFEIDEIKAEEEKKNPEKYQNKKENEKKEGGLSTGETVLTVLFAIVLSLGIFMVVPALIMGIIGKWVDNDLLLSFLEGILRILLFIGYVLLISRMKDIQRTFMYHGSEHKCINCIEHGLPLTIENVMKSSKEHKRCGTSFLLIVMMISIIVFMLFRVETILWRIVSRLLLIPVIAGISYEVLRLAGRYDNKFIDIISKPGLLMQGLTTKEPTPDMVEVAIKSVEAVFDWQEFLNKNFPKEESDT